MVSNAIPPFIQQIKAFQVGFLLAFANNISNASNSTISVNSTKTNRLLTTSSNSSSLMSISVGLRLCELGEIQKSDGT